MTLEAWNAEIDVVTQLFEEKVAALTDRKVGWKPKVTIWSVGDNIEHLILMTKSFEPIFEALVAGTYETPPLGYFGKMVELVADTALSSMKNRAKKIKTFPIWTPTKKVKTKTIIDAFVAQQASLKAHIQSVAHLLGEETVIASPAHKHLVYTLDQALEMILLHEKRHYQQIEDVLASMK